MPGRTASPARRRISAATAPARAHPGDDVGRLDARLVPRLGLAGVGVGRPVDVRAAPCASARPRPGSTRPSLRLWHRLYFRPLPHQHGSLACGRVEGGLATVCITLQDTAQPQGTPRPPRPPRTSGRDPSHRPIWARFLHLSRRTAPRSALAPVRGSARRPRPAAAVTTTRRPGGPAMNPAERDAIWARSFPRADLGAFLSTCREDTAPQILRRGDFPFSRLGAPFTDMENLEDRDWREPPAHVMFRPTAGGRTTWGGGVEKSILAGNNAEVETDSGEGVTPTIDGRGSGAVAGRSSRSASSPAWS